MGTRSLTRVYDLYNWNKRSKPKKKSKKTELLCMYKQYDGYPEGLGVELVEFMKGKEAVNGIPMDKIGKVFNGVGCLAAQLIAHFKKEEGSVYIYPTGSKGCGEEYEYHICWYGPGMPIELQAYDVGYPDAELTTVGIPASE